MTEETYLRKLKELEKDFKLKKNTLAAQFARENSPYKIGDILQDHYQIIRVERMGFYWGDGKLPECVYYGLQLMKNLEVKSDKRIPYDVQSNVKQKLN